MRNLTLGRVVVWVVIALLLLFLIVMAVYTLWPAELPSDAMPSLP